MAYAVSLVLFYLPVGGLSSFFSFILFASGWLTLILLGFFIFFFCQWVAYTVWSVMFLPVGGLLVASTWLPLVLFVFFFSCAVWPLFPRSQHGSLIA